MIKRLLSSAVLVCVSTTLVFGAEDAGTASARSGAPLSFQLRFNQILEEFHLLPPSNGTHISPAAGKLRGAILAALAERNLIPAATPGVDTAALTGAIRLKAGYCLMLLGSSVMTPGAIADGSVTTPKLANQAVTAGKIGSFPASAQFVLTADGIGGAAWLPLPVAAPANPSVGQSIRVGATNADFTTIQAAIDSVTDASPTKPYVILIFPGIYSEQIRCKDYVHLFGFGQAEYGVSSVAVEGNNDVITMGNCNISNMRFNLIPGGTVSGPQNSLKLVNGQNGETRRGAFSNCYFVLDGDYGAFPVKFCEQNGNADIYFENCSVYFRPISSVSATCFDAVNGTINATNLYMNHFRPSGNNNLIFWRKRANSGASNAPDELQLAYFREYVNTPALTLFVNENTQAPILVNGFFGIIPGTFGGTYTAGPGRVAFDSALAFPAVPLSNAITKTADYTALATDSVLRMDAASGARLVKLPPAAKVAGQTYKIKKIDLSANAVTVQADGTELIDGSNARVLTAPYEVLTLQSTGEGWDVF